MFRESLTNVGEPGAPGGAEAGAAAAAGAGSTAGGKYVPPSKRGKFVFLSLSISLFFLFVFLSLDNYFGADA